MNSYAFVLTNGEQTVEYRLTGYSRDEAEAMARELCPFEPVVVFDVS